MHPIATDVRYVAWKETRTVTAYPNHDEQFRHVAAQLERILSPHFPRGGSSATQPPASRWLLGRHVAWGVIALLVAGGLLVLVDHATSRPASIAGISTGLSAPRVITAKANPPPGAQGWLAAADEGTPLAPRPAHFAMSRRIAMHRAVAHRLRSRHPPIVLARRAPHTQEARDRSIAEPLSGSALRIALAEDRARTRALNRSVLRDLGAE